MVLPVDTADAPEASQIERVLAAFLSCVGGPNFTAVEQSAENTCLVNETIPRISDKR